MLTEEIEISCFISILIEIRVYGLVHRIALAISLRTIVWWLRWSSSQRLFLRVSTTAMVSNMATVKAVPNGSPKSHSFVEPRAFLGGWEGDGAVTGAIGGCKYIEINKRLYGVHRGWRGRRGCLLLYIL